MFYTISWFQQPEEIAAANLEILDWANSNELLVFFSNEEGEIGGSLEIRRLKSGEIEKIQSMLEEARHNKGFGGFTSNKKPPEVNGYCHFEILENGREACLKALFMPPALAGVSLFSSPVLHLALMELLFEADQLEKICLPFFDPTEEDKSILVIFDLYPEVSPGWWKLKNETGPEISSVSPVPSKTIPTWFELNVSIEGGLVPIVTLYLSYFGYNRQVITEWNKPEEALNTAEFDYSKPATIRTYLPFNAEAEIPLNRIFSLLSNLDKISPIQEMKIVEKTLEEWRAIWEDLNFFRIGQKLLVTLLNPSFSPEPGDIVIDLASSNEEIEFSVEGPGPATILALQLIEDYLDPLTHAQLLEIGRGTGVNSIFAAKLGVSHILTLCPTPRDLEVVTENLKRNKTLGQTRLAVFNPVSEKPKAGDPSFPALLEEFNQFDVVVVNQAAGTIKALLSSIASILRPGGLLITSGGFGKDPDEWLDEFEKAGFVLLNIRSKQKEVAFAHIKGSEEGEPEEARFHFLHPSLKW